MCVTELILKGLLGDIGKHPPEKGAAERENGIVIISYY
jgi:hypothetical protein